jgi:hypothetical protein
MNAVFLAAVHTFYKKPETTSKFWAPEGWHEETFNVSIHKYQASKYNIWRQREWAPGIYAPLYNRILSDFNSCLFGPQQMHLRLHITRHEVLLIRPAASTVHIFFQDLTDP